MTPQSVILVQERDIEVEQASTEPLLSTKKKRKLKDESKFRTLSDLKPLPKKSASKARMRSKGVPKKSKEALTTWVDSQDDLFELMLEQQIRDIHSAVNGLDETPQEKKTIKTIRDAMKEMLEERYRENLATKRQEAMLSGQYTFEDIQVYQLEDSRKVMFDVKYKSLHDKDWIVERHQAFTKKELKKIIRTVMDDPESEGEELLKPYKICFYSPRTFWSLVYHYKDVTEGLKALFPKHDWSSLETRKSFLTERAKEKMEAGESLYYESDEEEEKSRKKIKREEEAFTVDEETIRREEEEDENINIEEEEENINIDEEEEKESKVKEEDVPS